jgi:hypothetical protein
MFRLFVLCGALLCASLTAVAQDSVAFDASPAAGEPAAPASLIPEDRDPWQLGLGFQYQHFSVLGQSFHTLGINTDVARYVNNWFAVEGTATMGFGHTASTPSLDAKSLFLGGGPHITFSNRSRIEPWVHVLVGLDHFRFTQTNSALGSNSRLAFMAGGGADYKLGGRAIWRVQADFLGSKFGQASIDKSYSFGTGIVFSF